MSTSAVAGLVVLLVLIAGIGLGIILINHLLGRRDRAITPSNSNCPPLL